MVTPKNTIDSFFLLFPLYILLQQNPLVVKKSKNYTGKDEKPTITTSTT